MLQNFLAKSVSYNLINNFDESEKHFRMRLVSYDEVEKAMKSLRSDCSAGYDNTPAKHMIMRMTREVGIPQDSFLSFLK